MANLRKKGITLLKILFSFVLLYFVFTKIQFSEVWEILKGSNFYYLFAALLLFIISKVFSALRLNLYIHQIKIFLTQLSNIKLYLLGMFYNLFLPGGIGGDAYKGYVLKKQYEVKTKSVVSILILDRLNGLLLIFVISCLLALLLKEDRINSYKIFFGIAISLSILVFWVFNKRFFSFVYPVFWKSLGFSALVQLAQLVSVLFILKALDVEGNNIAYLFIFLISSIVSVLPLTIGGIGSREVVFYYGALWLALDENTSVSISMLFFLITALVSLMGIIYHFRKPELKETII
ncbi:lysylphosphatidylglycerol synthase transmembrane domain-containing protein [uncultured Eudoraea sp.]|uniref:lysylphosphatidylglycerol synthase transmembrane domain-containing protein n=1 Tax=uncultured Eudoraea sp. TaxID=1035614 RepID=UPI002624C050|nr:lysylphosphatidylglycerol synthase transmembrane domain-containing protein [uncultured Eudoraea sp.]